MNRNFLYRSIAVLVVSAFPLSTTYAAEVAPSKDRLHGTITAVGSDTMVDAIMYWSVAFKAANPNVKVQFNEGGSSTAPPALIDGTANIGPMSRKMKDSEVQAFVRKFGYPPTEIRVAIDALAVFLHKNNPLSGMTLPQVDAVFSETRQCGYPNDIKTWGQVGLQGPLEKSPIVAYTRDTKSGTYAFFAEHALCKGKYKSTNKMQSSSHEVAHFVKMSPGAIGYSGIGLLRDGGIRAVSLAEKEGQPFIAPTAENVYSGKYPLSRSLYLYVNKVPNKPLPALEREFLKMVLSVEGQQKVEKAGFLPLKEDVLREELAKLN